MEGISSGITSCMAIEGAFTLAAFILMILIIGKALRKKDFRCQGRKNG